MALHGRELKDEPVFKRCGGGCGKVTGTNTYTYNYTNTNYTTTTTTTASTASRAPHERGAEDLRRSIRSPVTAALLLALERGFASAEQLATEVQRVTGRRLRAKDVLAYLSYYRRKGWVVNHSPVWSLTEAGKAFVEKYRSHLLYLLGESYGTPSHTKVHTKVNESITLSHTKADERLILKKTKARVSETIELLKRKLKNRDEADALQILLFNYFENGSTYMYLDELAEELEADPSWLLRVVLRRMRSRGLVYVWRDGKVGLGRVVRELLGIPSRGWGRRGWGRGAG